MPHQNQAAIDHSEQQREKYHQRECAFNQRLPAL
jgi:hypothetical protein